MMQTSDRRQRPDHHHPVAPLQGQGRHRPRHGRPLTDIVQYYFGDFATAYGKGFIAEPIRRRQEKPEMQTEAYIKRFLEIPARSPPPARIHFIANYTMASGLPVQMTYIASGPGKGWNQRSIHGRNGSLEIFNDRTGKAPILHTAEGDLTGQALADKIGFKLDAADRKALRRRQLRAELGRDRFRPPRHRDPRFRRKPSPRAARPRSTAWAASPPSPRCSPSTKAASPGRAVTMDEVLDSRVSDLSGRHRRRASASCPVPTPPEGEAR